MELADGVFVAASREQVWDFLSDAARLSSCLTGFEAAEILAGGRGFSGSATISLGSQVLRFPTRVEWIQQQPPDGGSLRALSQIGSQQVTGEGRIALADAGSGTEVQWQIAVMLPVSLQENAMLHQVARNVATAVVRGFFSCLKERLGDMSEV